MEALATYGGVDAVAKALCSDAHKGLDPRAGGEASIEEHQRWYGANKFAEVIFAYAITSYYLEMLVV